MKKTKLFLSVLFMLSIGLVVNAQDKDKKDCKKSNFIDFNIGSADLGGGMQGYGNDAGFPGYWSETVAPFHFDIGYRRMLNSNIGLKADFAYDSMKNDDGSHDFKATFYSLRFQGIINLVNALESRNLYDKIGVSVHAGFGYSVMMLDESLTPAGRVYDNKNWDNIMNGVAGATLSYRLNDRWEIHGDYTVMFLGKVQTELDGTRGNHGHIDGDITNLTLGASVNVGKDRVNYDYDTDLDTPTDIAEGAAEYDAALSDMMVSINDLRDRLQAIESQPSGSITSEQELNLLKALFDENLVYAFFDFNRSEPNSSSNQAFIVAMKYLENVPSAKLMLTGYADKLGTDGYNQELGLKRAQRCKAILSELGVDPSRVEVRSAGEDKNYPAESEGSRQVVRRVQFSLQ